MDRLWVARLYVSKRTADKISQSHGIAEEALRDAVVCVAGLPFTWHDDPVRGRRAMIKVRIYDRMALVVIYPVQDSLGDSYNLGSAYFI